MLRLLIAMAVFHPAQASTDELRARVDRLEATVQNLVTAVQSLATSTGSQMPTWLSIDPDDEFASFEHQATALGTSLSDWFAAPKDHGLARLRRALGVTPLKPPPLDITGYKGVYLKTDKSMIAFGAKDDIVFARAPDGKLVITAKSIDFRSVVTVQGQPIRQDLADSFEAQFKDVQKELGILSKALAENAKQDCAKRNILVAYMPLGSTAHQNTGAVKSVKLSDAEINTIRGKWSESVFKVTCGACTAYVKQNRAFAAKGYTSANTKLSMCSKSPNGPYKDYGYNSHSLHYGIDCYNMDTGFGLVYEDNNGGGCNCRGSGRFSGTLTVMNALYCNDVKP